jgi:predicted nucleic acid-binding protein
MRVVFADSFYYFALTNPNDRAHAGAVEFTRIYSGRIVTTSWVVTEMADGWSRLNTRARFAPILTAMRSDRNLQIEPCREPLLQEGIDLYISRPDKEWSLTDCISFVVMSREGISEALTGDHHFEQAGFVALLK